MPQHRKKYEPLATVPNSVPPEPDRGWMNPLNKLLWRAAIEKRAKTVTINDGRVFVLDYDKVPGLVHYYPKQFRGTVNIGVPRGYLSIERVMLGDGEWILGD